MPGPSLVQKQRSMASCPWPSHIQVWTFNVALGERKQRFYGRPPQLRFFSSPGGAKAGTSVEAFCLEAPSNHVPSRASKVVRRPLANFGSVTQVNYAEQDGAPGAQESNLPAIIVRVESFGFEIPMVSVMPFALFACMEWM